MRPRLVAPSSEVCGTTISTIGMGQTWLEYLDGQFKKGECGGWIGIRAGDRVQYPAPACCD